MHRLTDRHPPIPIFIAIIVTLPFLLFWRWTLKGEVLYWGTSLLQFWPWHHLVKASLLDGEWPLWNPLLGNGTPLLANMQSAVFYPLNLVYLAMPVEQALTFSVILHLLLAGLFMYLYARQLGLIPFAATISALAYMFSGYVVGRSQFVTMVNAATWFPLLLYLSDRLVTGRNKLNVVWLSLVLALQLLAGHAQLWFYGLCLIGAYTLFRAWPAAAPQADGSAAARNAAFGPQANPQPAYWPRVTAIIRAGWRLVAAVGLSVLIAAVQLVPSAELASQSPRGEGAERIFALTYSFWPWRFVTLLAPDFFGNPARGNYWGYGNYWEDHAYVGVLPLILGFLAMGYYLKCKIFGGRSQPATATAATGFGCGTPAQPLKVVPFFATFIVLSLLLALGWNTPIYLWVFDHVPGFDLFQAPARLLIWYTLAIVVLAGVGAQVFESTARNRPHLRRFLAACVALTAAGFLGEYLVSGRELTFLAATRSTGILLIVSILLLIIRPDKTAPGRMSEKLWQGIVVIFVATDLLWAAWPLVPTLPATIFRRPIASAEFLKKQPQDFRFLVADQFAYDTTFSRYFQFKGIGPADVDFWQDFKETLVPNFGVYAALPSANNDDPLKVAHWLQLTKQLKHGTERQRARLMAVMNVGFFIDSTAAGIGPIIYNDDNLTIQQVNEALPRAYFVSRAHFVENGSEALTRLSDRDFDSRREVIIMEAEEQLQARQELTTGAEEGSVTVNELGPGQLQLLADLSGPGYVVLTDTYYPGWQASIDGRTVPILQANLAFRAVAIEAGQHEILFLYRPRSFTIGLWTSILICSIIGVLIARSLWNRRKEGLSA